jgi:hypothetical protein
MQPSRLDRSVAQNNQLLREADDLARTGGDAPIRGGEEVRDFIGRQRAVR